MKHHVFRARPRLLESDDRRAAIAAEIRDAALRLAEPWAAAHHAHDAVKVSIAGDPLREAFNCLTCGVALTVRTTFTADYAANTFSVSVWSEESQLDGEQCANIAKLRDSVPFSPGTEQGGVE